MSITVYGPGREAVQGPMGSDGFKFLGSTVLAASAVATSVVTIQSRDLLLIVVRVTGYSGAGDIASLRFNGDSGTNYWSKPASSAAATTAITTPASTTGANLARLFAAATTQGRSANVSITNFTTTHKLGTVSGCTGSTGPTAGGTLEANAFGWTNTTAQITTIELRTAGGSVTMAAGTGFAVFGRDLT